MTDSKSKPNLEQAAPATPLRWPWWTGSLPENPTIIIKFDGLLAFCFNDDASCEVGVLKGILKHSLEIVIHDLDTGRSKEFKNDSNPMPDIRLEVITPKDFLTGPMFFKAKERREDLDPTDAKDILDFRWMLDLEDHIYPHEVSKIPGRYVPKFRITHGIFRTVDLTPEKFKLVGKKHGGEKEIRQLPREMAANIYLKAGAGALLKWGDKVETFVAGKKYEVSFTNLCKEVGGGLCKFFPNSPDETRRNDFHFYFETFNVGAKEEKFTLRLLGRRKFKSTDDAPCGHLGYGRSSGLG